MQPALGLPDTAIWGGERSWKAAEGIDNSGEAESFFVSDSLVQDRLALGSDGWQLTEMQSNTDLVKKSIYIVSYKYCDNIRYGFLFNIIRYCFCESCYIINE